MKKFLALLLIATMAVSMVACSTSSTNDKELNIGIIQLAQHDALDAANQGFQDKLTELATAKGYTVNYDNQNASGEQSNCATISSKFANDKVDLILAIATPAAQAAAQASSEIPILVTAVTDPASSGLVATNEAPGGNVSGTSDMNPIAEQTALIKATVPDAKTVGIMYCSSEDNSVLQAELAQAELEALGFAVEVATASDSNDIQAVTTALCEKVDAIYIPTDNTFAAAMTTVSAVTTPAGIPVFPGEESMTLAGGLATYSVDYYNLGALTAEMAAEILIDGANVSEMPIRYSSADDLKFVVNDDTAKALGIEPVMPE